VSFLGWFREPKPYAYHMPGGGRKPLFDCSDEELGAIAAERPGVTLEQLRESAAFQSERHRRVVEWWASTGRFAVGFSELWEWLARNRVDRFG
jgi:hypothetical protein